MAKHRRSVTKAISYRLFASSAKIGLTAAVAKTALYYLWERVWSHIDWGTEPV